MAKLFFNYSTMNAGKSTILLQAAHNYEERGMVPYLLTAEIDKRSGEGKIASRIGIEKRADTFNDRLNLYNLLKLKQKSSPIACVLIDEAQFLTKEQVWQLARAVDVLFLPVLCYGLRVDFQGNLFPGSSALLGLADELKEIKTICHCGKKPPWWSENLQITNLLKMALKYRLEEMIYMNPYVEYTGDS